MNTKSKFVLIAALLASLLYACTAQSPSPVPTPQNILVAQERATNTPTPPPTDTPIPTNTPIPSATPMPTLTLTPSPTPTPTNTPDPGPEWIEIGRSVQDHPLEVVRIGTGHNNVILVGGLHAGFVPGSVTLANRAIDHFSQNPDDIPASVTLFIVPNANPDSPYNPGELAGRLNANGVDLNRNWDCRWTADPSWRNIVRPGMGGTTPLSEPETRALADFILAQNPQAVIFWQAVYTNGLASPGNCGVRNQNSEELAGTYGLAAGYRIADFEQLTNQVINGDVSNWLDSQGIAAVSILLSNYTNADWNNNLAGILATLRAYD